MGRKWTDSSVETGTSVAAGDLILTVSDPSGTPVSKKITVQNLMDSESVREAIRDHLGDVVIQGGANVTITHDDPSDTITVAVTSLDDAPVGATTPSTGSFTVNTVDQLVFDIAAAIESNTAGEMSWDADAETVMLALNDNIHMHVGQDSLYHALNQTGSDIAKGTAVYALGTVGNSGKITIAPFTADGTLDSKYFMGVTAETIVNGETGFVTHFGKIRKIDTTDFEEGDILYADPSVAGGLTNVRPAAPNNIITVAIVVTKHHNVGELFVRPTFIDGFADNEDVTITSATTNDILAYNGTVWVNTDSPTFAGLTVDGGAGDATIVFSTTQNNARGFELESNGNNFYFRIQDAGAWLWKSNADADLFQISNAGVVTGFGNWSTSGTITAASDLTLAAGSITSASGAISFGNENLSTTGTILVGGGAIGRIGLRQSSDAAGNGIGITNAASSAAMRIWMDGTDAKIYNGSTGASDVYLGPVFRVNGTTGNITTTGTLSSGAATVTGTLTVVSDSIILDNNQFIRFKDSLGADKGVIQANSFDVVRIATGSTWASVDIDKDTSITGTLDVSGVGRFGTSVLTANATYDNVVIEAASNTGLSIITNSTTGDAGIMLGAQSNTTGAMFRYNETGGNAVLATRIAGHDLILRSGNNTTALTLDSSQNATFAGNVTIDGGTGVATSGVLQVRQSGDTVNDGIGITSSSATSHRIWKNAGGALNIGPSTDPDAWTQDLSGNVTMTAGDLTLSAGDLEVQKNDELNGALIRLTNTAQSSTWGTGDVIGTVDFYASDTSAAGSKAKIYAAQNEGSSYTYPADVSLYFQTSANNVLATALELDQNQNATFAGYVYAQSSTIGTTWVFDGATDGGVAVGAGYADGRLYAEGSQSASLVLHDSGGTANLRTIALQINGDSAKLYGYNDSGTLRHSWIEMDQSTGDMTLGAGDLTLSANNSTLTFATDTVSPGDRLGAIVFHDTDGATGANSGELHITGERGNDKDAPDYVLKIADASGVLTERDRIDGTTGARTLTGDLTLSAGDLAVNGNVLVDGAGNNARITTSASDQSNWAFFGNTALTDGWYVGQGITANDGNLRIRNAENSLTVLTLTEAGNATFTGDLRIGTTSAGPNSENLVVDSGASGIAGYFDSGVTQRTLVLHTDDTTNGKQLVLHDAGSSGYATSMIGSKSDALLFYTGSGGAEAMRITSGGDLLIGTTSATSHGNEVLRVLGGNSPQVNFDSGSSGAVYLHVTNSTTGSTANDGLLFGIDASENAIWRNKEATASLFYTNDTERFRVASDAYAIGIGTTDVKSWDTSYSAVQFSNSGIMAAGGSGDTMYLLSNAYFDGSWKYFQTNEAARQLIYNGTFEWETASAGTAGGAITWSEKMRLTNDGDLGIGTDTPDTKLDITTSGAQGLILNQDTVTGTNSSRLFFNASGGGFGVYSNNGTLSFTSGATAGSSSGATKMGLTSGGMLLVGDTANANMTVGLTINQGANDDEILALKSSDVNHAMTTLTEQDTYGGFKKASSSGGGLAIRGYTETSLGFLIHSYATTSDSTKSTAGNGTVEIRGLEKSGTSATTFTGSENILAVKNNTTTAFIVGADGDLWMGGETLTVATSKTPSSASDTGTTGMIAWDSSYIYVCTATNTWKRAAISTW